MKHLFFLILVVFPSLIFSQITVTPDTLAGKFLITTVVENNDGSVVSITSASLDTTEFKNRLFQVSVETYAAIGRINDELVLLNKQGTQVRNEWSKYEKTISYFDNVAKFYATGLYGEYTFRQNGSSRDVEFKANAQGQPIAQTGSTRGTIRMYAPTYIEIRGYFTTSGGTPIDVFLCKKNEQWVTEIDGKKIVLRKKK